MKKILYTLIKENLANHASITLPICELERIAGDDWLLEVNEQALRLNARAQLHEKDPRLVLIVRD